MDGDSVTFRFELADAPHAQLILRCDARGEVYACIPAPRAFRAGGRAAD